ncbi:MAG: AAA family ATPase [Bauldia sp.]
MFIGDLLIAHGLVNQADINAALDRQRTQGGLLGENLIALGKITPSDLASIIQSAPQPPKSIAETGIAQADLLNLMMKAMYSAAAETASKIADVIKLPHRIVQLLTEEARERKLIEALGGTGGTLALSELRFTLTEKGKAWALDALSQNQYVGPAPVPLTDYTDRIRRQRISGERVDREQVDHAFANLIISEEFVRAVGPAINSGRSILLYGPPGNGKTSVAERIGSVFADVIYIPYCFEVEGQIIKVFDPSIHKAAMTAADSASKGTALRREDFDRRWVACRRPFIVTGGELTLEMLDLSFNAIAKFYEAPLHIKALGGTFVIDDFGRQIIKPEELLNRWIVPLESRVEYLKLHTGKSFSLPFDELVIFSTNLAPRDLMDPAFLRRIPYKMEVGGPPPDEYRRIFKTVANGMKIDVSDEIIDFVLAELRERNDFPLAGYQPKFIIEQVKAACKFEGTPEACTIDLVKMALGNLYTKDTPGFGVTAAARARSPEAQQELARQAFPNAA